MSNNKNCNDIPTLSFRLPFRFNENNNNDDDDDDKVKRKHWIIVKRLFQNRYRIPGCCIQGNNCRYGTHKDELKFAYDFYLPIGTPIVAAKDGIVVVTCGYYKEGGVGKHNVHLKARSNFIILRHKQQFLHDDDHHDNNNNNDNGNNKCNFYYYYYSRYYHLAHNSIMVNVGDHVNAGQIIALSGNTGYSSCPHIHFDVTDSCQFETSVLELYYDYDIDNNNDNNDDENIDDSYYCNNKNNDNSTEQQSCDGDDKQLTTTSGTTTSIASTTNAIEKKRQLIHIDLPDMFLRSCIAEFSSILPPSSLSLSSSSEEEENLSFISSTTTSLPSHKQPHPSTSSSPPKTCYGKIVWANPKNASIPLLNSKDEVNGLIVLVERCSTTNFITKCMNVQNANGIGMIVINYEDGPTIHCMGVGKILLEEKGGNDDTTTTTSTCRRRINIPAIMISCDYGKEIDKLLLLLSSQQQNNDKKKIYGNMYISKYFASNIISRRSAYNDDNDYYYSGGDDNDNSKKNHKKNHKKNRERKHNSNCYKNRYYTTNTLPIKFQRQRHDDNDNDDDNDSKGKQRRSQCPERIRRGKWSRNLKNKNNSTNKNDDLVLRNNKQYSNDGDSCDYYYIPKEGKCPPSDVMWPLL